MAIIEILKSENGRIGEGRNRVNEKIVTRDSHLFPSNIVAQGHPHR
jgi:hypothetical protein